MRTITNLLSLGGRVWGYLSSTDMAKTFLKNAEDEGSTGICDSPVDFCMLTSQA